MANGESSVSAGQVYYDPAYEVLYTVLATFRGSVWVQMRYPEHRRIFEPRRPETLAVSVLDGCELVNGMTENSAIVATAKSGEPT